MVYLIFNKGACYLKNLEKCPAYRTKLGKSDVELDQHLVIQYLKMILIYLSL